jgi:hypothetical protein
MEACTVLQISSLELLRVISTNVLACFIMMLNGLPNTNQLSRLVPKVSHSYKDVIDQVVGVLYFCDIFFLFDAHLEKKNASGFRIDHGIPMTGPPHLFYMLEKNVLIN